MVHSVTELFGSFFGRKSLRGLPAGNLSKKGENSDNFIPLDCQTYVVPGSDRVHVSPLSKDNPDNYEKPLFTIFEDVRTLYDIPRQGLIKSKNGNCLGWRPNDKSPYQWLSYETTLKRSVNFGRGLRHLGVEEKEYVGIYSKNRIEWVLTDQGIHTFSMVIVPLYDTLGPTACNFIITQADISTVVLENSKNLEAILENCPPCLRNIIYMDAIADELLKKAKDAGLNLYQFQEVEKIGLEQGHSYPERPPQPDDIATLSYTSGTTGTPKGVIITHANLVSNCCGFVATLGPVVAKEIFDSDCVMISFLPLAHSYERIVEGIIMMHGCAIGFYGGDVFKLVDDIQMLQPTILPCVPRLLNRIYDKIINAANESALRRFMITRALMSKGKEVERGILRTDSIWDQIVFRKVQNTFGGRLRAVISSGAPINAEILHFFRCALGCLVLEPYGQTEGSGSITCTLAADTSTGHVGIPIACTALKLVDVPEMNYFADKDQGELCIKGPTVFQGYHKNPEETEKAFDADGWFHSGDIATWLPNGTLKIIDRKKNIFKLSQGEYVAPEKIEIIYSRCPAVTQVFVYGDSLESYLVGIVVPDPEYVKNNYPNVDIKALCTDPKVKAEILEAMTKLGRDNGLKSFEQVKGIYLHPNPFTLEQGLLTPTMKAKRPELKKYFQAEIRRLYDNSKHT